MQLILTADQAFWSETRPVLFLGEWCKLHRAQVEWRGFESVTLPYHWDDRNAFRVDTEKLRLIKNDWLGVLGTALNQIHEVEYPAAFWDVLVGPWLYSFIPVLFDRYRSLQAARNTGLVTEVSIPLLAPSQSCPRDYHHYSLGTITDSYNQGLYGQIIRELGLFPFKEVAAETSTSAAFVHPIDNPSRWRRWGKIAARNWLKLSSHFQTAHFFMASYLGRSDLLQIQLRLGQIPIPDFLPDDCSPVEFEPALREEFRRRLARGSQDEFTRLLSVLMAQELPRIYLEGWKNLQSAAQKTFPSRAKTIFTANAHNYHETFKFWAAEQKIKGVPLILSQHGGHTGTGRWSDSDEEDFRRASKYFTWGWQRQDLPQCQPLPAGKLTRISVRPDPKGNCLLVMNGFPRFFYRSYTVPVAGQVLSYLADQISFVEALSPDARSRLRLRPYPINYEWQETDRLRERLPDLYLSNARNFREALLQSAIFIGNHNTTTFLETLAADFPTLLFWNPAHWELHPEAESHFQKLREAGILYSDPLLAAKKLSNILDNIPEWWASSEVQNARRAFIEVFAWRSPDWKRRWVRALRNATPAVSLQESGLNLSFSHGPS